MQHDPRKLVRDMQTFIQELEEFLDGLDLAAFEQDRRTLRAVEMQFVLISEVLTRMERIPPEVHLRVAGIREIAGMRNRYS